LYVGDFVYGGDFFGVDFVVFGDFLVFYGGFEDFSYDVFGFAFYDAVNF